MSLKLEGIVLSRTEYGETTLIVDFYSLEKGRTTFSATSSKKSNKRFYFSPFSYLGIELYQSKKGMFYRLKEVHSLHADQLVNRDSEIHAIRYFLAELLKKCLGSEESDPATFRFLIERLQLLYQTTTKGRFILEFLEDLTPCLGIDLEEIRNEKEVHNRHEFGMSQEEWENLKGAKNENNKAKLNALLAFYSHHFEGLKQMKSKTVLAEVFT